MSDSDETTQPLLEPLKAQQQYIIVVPSEEKPIYPPCGIIGGIKDTFMFIWGCVKYLTKYPLKGLVIGLTHPLFLVIILVILSGYFSGVMMCFAQEYQRIFYRHHPDITMPDFALDDIGFTLIPFVDMFSIADVFIGSTIIICLGIRFFITKYRLVIMRRYFFLMFILFMMRGICLYITILPDCSIKKSTATGNPFIEGILISTGIHFATADKLFSGHTMSVIMIALFWHHYSTKAPIFHLKGFFLMAQRKIRWLTKGTLMSVLISIYILAGCTLFIMLRRHYTVDVFIAAILSWVIFNWYHNYIKTCCTKDDGISNFILWLEQDAPDISKKYYMKNEIKNDIANM